MILLCCAKSLVDTPWKHQGRHNKQGLDCGGVVVVTARNAGLANFKDLRGYEYGKSLPVETLAKQNCLEAIPFEDSQPGDVLTFWIQRRNHTEHLAIKTENGMIHAVAEISNSPRRAFDGKVVEEEITGFWKKRAMTAYKFPIPKSFL